MSAPHVVLVAVDEVLIERLLAVAVRDADPAEVMAPVAGPPGWTQVRRDAFADYHRRCWAPDGSDGIREKTFAVIAAGEVVGAARLAAVDNAPQALEVGLWLGRASRGRGIAGAVLPAAAHCASELGAELLIARTSTANPAAVAALRSRGFELSLEPTGTVNGALPLR